ncbi:hypothetical protein [Bosea sp. PAMC 26642]|uniref:hypothetical protein n=1 Tax=Bosea sp. (strain PAMC 26642) TaxID=1792307 RepID=UPI000AA4A8B6|nr:hypothetical protein [Bosea sp. PAMC 26642]
MQCAVLPLVAFCLLQCSAALAEEVRFEVSLAWIHHQVSPKVQSRQNQRSIIVTLKPGNRVEESILNTVDGNASRALNFSRQGGLGEEFGERRKSAWKVVNANTLARVQDRKTYSWVIWLRTDGQKRCTVTMEWKLKPGQTEYVGWASRLKQEFRFTEPTDIFTSCRAIIN